MSTVRYLDGREGMIAALEHFLALVRDGKIEYLALVAETVDHDANFAWAGLHSSVPVRRLLGTLEYYKRQLMADTPLTVDSCG